MLLRKTIPLSLCGICLATLTYAGTIRGKISDSKTGEPMQGATVHLEHTRYTTTVNLDGSFVFRHIPAGKYEMVASTVGYRKSKEIDVELSSDNDSKEIFITLSPESGMLEEVQVTTATNGESDKRVRRLEQRSDVVQNILSANTIQLSPDVTVANALQRISGVTIERSSSGEGRYAIIRGMDERYNNTLVNGIKIPSPDSKYRYVPMDLFPSDMLERLEVIKSLTPSMEADAVGGTMNLVMKSAPQSFLLNANVAAGLTTLFSSDRPFSAFPHSAVNQRSPAQINGNAYAATQNDYSRGNLNFTNKNRPINTTAGLTIGDRFLHKKLGVILSASYQNMYRGSNSDFIVPNAQPQVIGELNNQATFSDTYLRQYSTQTTRWGLHNKFDYVIDNRNRISLYNMYVHMDEFQARSTYDTVFLNKLVDQLERSRWQKQSIYNSTLQGEHLIDNRFRLNWTGAYSLAKGSIPDMAEYDVQSQGDPSKPYIVQKMDRIWQHNKDQDLAGYLTMFYTPRIAGRNLEFSFGGMYRHKTRDNYYNPYTLDPVLVNSLPQTYTDFNAAQYFFKVAGNAQGINTTQNANTYSAHENVAAGFIQVKFMVTEKLQVLGGARIENTRQGYTTVMDESFANRAGTFQYTDLLPSLHLKYLLTNRQNLRLSYFKSIVRPDFYEKIPTETVGEVFNVLGNPHLKHAQADNIDLRYEFFPRSADQILIGAFYKRIQDPIENAITRNGGPSAQFLTPENFGNAHNYGFEVVLTKYFGKFGISANYTYTKSKITTTKQFIYRDDVLGITSKTVEQSRPLQGQADNIGNVALLYKNPQIGLDFQVAFVYTGKRITQVSPFYNLDYWQLGQGTLDLSFEKKIGRHFAFYGKAANLTNTPVKTVLYQANTYRSGDNKLPDQAYNDKIVVGKDIYKINFLGGFRYKF